MTIPSQQLSLIGAEKHNIRDSHLIAGKSSTMVRASDSRAITFLELMQHGCSWFRCNRRRR